VLDVVEVAGDHDVGRVVLGLDQPGGLQPAHFRHRQIHQHHLRAQRFGTLDGFEPVGGTADDLYPLHLAEVAHRGVDETFMVVDQQHGELAHGNPCSQPARAREGLAFCLRRSRAGAMSSCSRYFATVRRAMFTPCRASSRAMASSASGRAAGSVSISRFTIALTACPEMLAPSRRTAKKCFSSNVPRGVCRYLPEVMRDTVDSCMPMASATSFRVRGAIASSPRIRNPAWRSTTTRAVRSRVS